MDTLPDQTPPALTLENVFEAVKATRWNWRKVGDGLGVFSSVLNSIADQYDHDSEEVCLKAVIDIFLRGEGYYHYQPSWRRVIHALYRVGETRIAQDIINYAEPVEGESVPV